MFEHLFERYKKKKLNSVKTQEELEVEFEKIKTDYASIGTSEVYLLLKEYFLTKMELNRDLMEEANIDDPAQVVHIRKAQAENRVYLSIISDIEGMIEQLQQDL